MTHYLEEFLINKHTYGIEILADDKFQLWYGGCGIGKTKTIGEAREILWHYAISQNRAERDSAKRALDKADATLRKLGEDSFYLAKFLTGQSPKEPKT